ncbi:hydroxyacid dehydrogenase [Streptomyces sp. NPDC051940]|uniref:hydroxyacid dehydrogenase n=1 Tax=Streptomyces sp. NPDC051940 TaxID=3155675 RepID=UPI0034341A85
MSPTIAVALEEGLRRLFFTAEQWRELESAGEVRVSGTDPDRLAKDLTDADIVVTGWNTPRLDGELLAAAPRLKLVAHTGAALRFLVGDEVFARGVRVSQAGEAMAPAVAEVSLAFTLALLHRIHRFDHALHSGAGWTRTKYGTLEASELRGSVIGVVGASRTGRAYMELIRALGGVLLLTDPMVDAGEAAALGAELVSLDDLLRRSRIVALHAPAIPETREMIGRRELALMHDGAGLVNTARSWLVDSDALLEELRDGRLDGALDVYDEEPLPVASPLRGLPNVLLTPHEAAGAVQVRRRQGRIVVDEIGRFLAGEPLRHEMTREILSTTA